MAVDSLKTEKGQYLIDAVDVFPPECVVKNVPAAMHEVNA